MDFFEKFAAGAFALNNINQNQEIVDELKKINQGINAYPCENDSSFRDSSFYEEVTDRFIRVLEREKTNAINEMQRRFTEMQNKNDLLLTAMITAVQDAIQENKNAVAEVKSLISEYRKV